MRVLVLDNDEILCRVLAEVLEALAIDAACITDRALQEYARRKGVLLLSKLLTQWQLFDAVNVATAESIGKN